LTLKLAPWDALNCFYILGAWPFLTFTDFKIYVVTLLEGSSADVVDMNEKVASALLLNETITLVAAEPFDFTLWHPASPIALFSNTSLRSVLFDQSDALKSKANLIRFEIKIVGGLSPKLLNVFSFF
jgi:hypothetical protein